MDTQGQEVRYLGVVGGGYDETIGTDRFKVVVPSNAKLRHEPVLARWTIVSVDTTVWDEQKKGAKAELKTVGIVEDVNIVPAHAFEDARQMAHSDYYVAESFPEAFSSTAEDAAWLLVRSIGHKTKDGRDLYGPVRPPERESRTYVATPEEVQLALMKPMNLQAGAYTIGGYATLDGLYKPFTPIQLPYHQIFLHGALFAASGWGKTMAIKHFLKQFHALTPSPAIVIFNIKGSEFYDLEQALPKEELEKIANRTPYARELWEELKLKEEGLDPQRVSYYPMVVDVRGKGRIYGFSFQRLEPDDVARDFIRFVVEPFNLPEPSQNYLMDYFFFFKQHLTDRARATAGHARANAVIGGQRRPCQDTFSDFLNVFREAARAGPGGHVNIECQQCSERVSVPDRVAEAISRVLSELRRINVFDVGTALATEELLRPGHVHVIDLAGVQSGLAQQIFVQHVLHSIFARANDLFLKGGDQHYAGVVLFLDEAWRFLRTPRTLDELETIGRMGRSLRLGLWLADQNIPTGQREWDVLNNIRTRLLGSITADPPLLRRVMPMPDTMLSVLPNLRRGMALVFNQEYSRLATPTVIPPCTCYHVGD